MMIPVPTDYLPAMWPFYAYLYEPDLTLPEPEHLIARVHVFVSTHLTHY